MKIKSILFGKKQHFLRKGQRVNKFKFHVKNIKVIKFCRVELAKIFILICYMKIVFLYQLKITYRKVFSHRKFSNYGFYI